MHDLDPRWLVPDGLQRRFPHKVNPPAKSKATAAACFPRARGAAQAQEIVRATLSDSYLQYLWIKTLAENPNVIYVATEANLPIFKAAK